MSKKDLFLLILPVIGSALFGILIVIAASFADNHFFEPRSSIAKANFEKFAKEVETGKQQVPRTLDRYASLVSGY